MGAMWMTAAVVACSSDEAEFSPVDSTNAGAAGAPWAGSGNNSAAGVPNGGSPDVGAAGTGFHVGGGSGEGGSGEGGSGTAGEGPISGGAPAGGAPVGDAGGRGGEGGQRSCLTGWPGSECDICSGETQADRAKCKALLECYEKHDCGPTSCAGDGQPCGTAAIGAGNAPYPIAADVYQCRCE